MPAIAPQQKYHPQWTRRVAVDGSGRDPLGFSRVSDAVVDYLLRGITTTTDRARYYSFYTWAIADIEALRNSKSTPVDFQEEFQRREAALALSSALGKDSGLPIVGIRQVEMVLSSTDEDEDSNHTRPEVIKDLDTWLKDLKNSP